MRRGKMARKGGGEDEERGGRGESEKRGRRGGVLTRTSKVYQP